MMQRSYRIRRPQPYTRPFPLPLNVEHPRVESQLTDQFAQTRPYKSPALRHQVEITTLRLSLDRLDQFPQRHPAGIPVALCRVIGLSLIHISEPTRRTPISYAV